MRAGLGRLTHSFANRTVRAKFFEGERLCRLHQFHCPAIRFSFGIEPLPVHLIGSRPMNVEMR